MKWYEGCWRAFELFFKAFAFVFGFLYVALFLFEFALGGNPPREDLMWGAILMLLGGHNE